MLRETSTTFLRAFHGIGFPRWKESPPLPGGIEKGKATESAKLMEIGRVRTDQFPQATQGPRQAAQDGVGQSFPLGHLLKEREESLVSPLRRPQSMGGIEGQGEVVQGPPAVQEIPDDRLEDPSRLVLPARRLKPTGLQKSRGVPVFTAFPESASTSSLVIG